MPNVHFLNLIPCSYRWMIRASRVTAFVPITLKFEAEGKQINEVFSWDPNQSETNITKFAVTFATEAGLSQRYQTIVEQEIKRQIKLCKVRASVKKKRIVTRAS